MAAQNFKNHIRFDPKFHFFLLPLLLICFIASIVHVVHHHSRPNVLLVPVTFSLFLIAGLAREYALKVQDRVIRLEEQTRMRWLGIDPTGLTVKQFVGLRFAPDEELAALTARAKAESLTSKQIKQAVVNWRADDDRV